MITAYKFDLSFDTLDDFSQFLIFDWHDAINRVQFHFSKLGKKYACDNIITYDIETSNGFYDKKTGRVFGFDHDKYNNDSNYRDIIDNAQAMSLTSHHQIAIDAGTDIYVILFRTWDEFKQVFEYLAIEIKRQMSYGFNAYNRAAEQAAVAMLKPDAYAKIFVHNLGFEFQHLRNVCRLSNVFAREKRHPMKCNTYFNNLKFTWYDTAVLTQKSLKQWAIDESLPVLKQDEPDNFYLSIRTPDTPYTHDEIRYCIYDVVTMVYGLRKYAQKCAGLHNIPLTQTGFTRKKCREKVCVNDPAWAAQCSAIMVTYTPEQYKIFLRLFSGGWVHANAHYVNQIMHNVSMFDFASSYPAVMCTKQFPNSPFEPVDPADYAAIKNQDVNAAEWRWYAFVHVTDAVATTQNTFWSSSKCTDEFGAPASPIGATKDNGRILDAVEFYAYMTDLDFDIFTHTYDADIEIIDMYKSKSGYLGRELILTVLDYYAAKTNLKNVAGAESKYMEAKQFINSIYGCAVTRLIDDPISYSTRDGWASGEYTVKDFTKTINAETPDKTFLAYQHGVWITAWARHNLWDIIRRTDGRMIYGDTDSVKGVFTQDDINYINDYNAWVEQQENTVATFYNFDPDLFCPCTPTGEPKRLGIMADDGHASDFVTLGCKRYCYVSDRGKDVGEMHMTVAGLPKSAAEKLTDLSVFTPNTIWDTRESHKKCAIYNDNQTPATWIDRDGVAYTSHDRFGTCIKPVEYDMSMTPEFTTLLDHLIFEDFYRADIIF